MQKPYIGDLAPPRVTPIMLRPHYKEDVLMKKTLKLLAASILAVILITVTAGSVSAKAQTQACWGNTCVSGSVDM